MPLSLRLHPATMAAYLTKSPRLKHWKIQKTQRLRITAKKSCDFQQQKNAAVTSVSGWTLAGEGTVRGIGNTVGTIEALVRRARVKFRGTVRSGVRQTTYAAVSANVINAFAVYTRVWITVILVVLAIVAYHTQENNTT